MLSVDQLVVPSFPDLTLNTIEWMRNEITKNIELLDSEVTPDQIYLSRQNVNTRRVVNYAEIEAVLEKYGVQPVIPEYFSQKEQIRLFSTADGVVGPHGVGLTGTVWGSNLCFLEIFNNSIQPPYYVLAHILDHHYSALSPSPTGKKK